MKKQKLIAGFILILQSPLILAINCDLVSQSNQDICMEILNSNLTDNEKKILLSNLEYTNQFFPDHDYLFNLNSNIKVKSEEVQTQNKTLIKNAWMKISSLTPSVLYNNKLYVPEKTLLSNKFNYEIKLPEDYHDSDYSGNKVCKTTYSLIENKTENKIYINGKYSEVNLTIKKDSEIKAELIINIKIKIKNYKWRKYCISRKNGICRSYSKKCRFDNEEIKKETLKLTDKINVSLYKNNFFASISPVNLYERGTNLKINYSDSVRFIFADSKYVFNKYVYSLEEFNPPYYVLKARDYNQEKEFNLFEDNNILTVKNTDECRIKAFDFFSVINKNCNASSHKINFFIKTDKLKYKKGEKIKIEIFPDNISVILKYGDEIKTAEGNAVFNAEIYENKITAEFNGLKSGRVIYIMKKEKFQIILDIVLFCILNYLFYLLIKKYFQKIK